MNPEVAIPAFVGVVPGSMVAYIIEFLVGVGLVYLAVLGAVKLWDFFSTSTAVLYADWKLSRASGTSILSVWKDRLASRARHSAK